MPIGPPGSFGGHPYPAMALKAGFNRFITFRGNKVHSNGGIVIRGTSANTLVTGSVIENSHVGIHVNDTTTTMFGDEGGGVVVVDNKEPANVPSNYNPYGPIPERSGGQDQREELVPPIIGTHCETKAIYARLCIFHISLNGM